MPVKKALLYNFLSACTSFGGLALGIMMGDLETSVYVFAFAGGLFLYVSLTDLVSFEIKIWGCIQKFLDWVDNEMYTYNNKHLLRSNTKGYGGKPH